MCKVVEIDAENEVEARKLADDLGADIDVTNDGAYVEDSFEAGAVEPW